jgi:hypothetical protein
MIFFSFCSTFQNKEFLSFVNHEGKHGNEIEGEKRRQKRDKKSLIGHLEVTKLIPLNTENQFKGKKN